MNIRVEQDQAELPHNLYKLTKSTVKVRPHLSVILLRYTVHTRLHASVRPTLGK